MRTEAFIENLNFYYREELKKEFKSGTLGKKWRLRYPDLFDKDGLRIYETQGRKGIHFYEWLSAIILYEATGYHSFIEKYWSAKHKKKLPIYEKIIGREVLEFEEEKGWPDLFCYRSDHKDWLFCEVKGHRDFLRPHQIKLFRKLHRVTEKRVRVLYLKPLRWD